jgi:hypothetical protein
MNRVDGPVENSGNVVAAVNVNEPETTIIPSPESCSEINLEI